jgi:hypothetical protein
MRFVEFVPFRLTEMADIFSIRIDGKENTELQEFFITFKKAESPNLQNDFEQIIKTLAGEHKEQRSRSSAQREK